MGEQVLELRRQIEQGFGGSRTEVDIILDEPDYINLAGATIRDVAALYVSALDLVDVRQLDRSEIKLLRTADGPLEAILDDAERPVVLIAEEIPREVEFAAIARGKVIAAGYGKPYDYFQTVDFFGHPAAVDLAVRKMSPGATRSFSFSQRSLIPLRAAFGVPVPQRQAENDGRSLTYEVSQVPDVSTNEVSSPRDANITRSAFSNLYWNLDF